MKYLKTIIVPGTTGEIIAFVSCDLCKEKIPTCEDNEVNEIKLYHKTGKQRLGIGSGETVEVDICDKCFDEKLIPWLRTQGAEPHTEEWSW